MKWLRIERIIAWLLLIIMGLIVVHAPVTVFIGSHWPAIADIVKAWKELLLLLALVLLAVDYTRRKQWRMLFRDRLMWLVAGYGLLHGLVALVARLPLMQTIAGLMIDLRFIAFFVAVYTFLQLYPFYRRAFLYTALGGACLVVGFAAMELLLPRDFLTHLGYGRATIEPYLTVDKNPDFVRFNSTLRGPNPLGAYAMMVLAGAVAYGVAVKRSVTDWRIKSLHAMLATGSAVALWISYSRSAWLGALLSVVIIIVVSMGKKLPRKTWMTLLLGTLVLAGGIWLARDSYFVKNVFVHDNPTTGATIDSNAGHVESLLTGVRRLMTQPLGAGIGSTGSASLDSSKPFIIENQYLFVAHEVGWLGLLLFITISYVVLSRLWAKRRDWMSLAVFASGVGLAVIGLLLPVWADDTVSIVWWGLAASMIVKGEGDGTTTHKKAKRTA